MEVVVGDFIGHHGKAVKILSFGGGSGGQLAMGEFWQSRQVTIGNGTGADGSLSQWRQRCVARALAGFTLGTMLTGRSPEAKALALDS